MYDTTIESSLQRPSDVAVLFEEPSVLFTSLTTSALFLEDLHHHRMPRFSLLLKKQPPGFFFYTADGSTGIFTLMFQRPKFSVFLTVAQQILPGFQEVLDLFASPLAIVQALDDGIVSGCADDVTALFKTNIQYL